MLAAAVAVSALVATAIPKIAVLDIEVGQGVEVQDRAVLTDALASALHDPEAFDLVATRDVTALLGLQLQKQVQAVIQDAEKLCELASEQKRITGKDPLCGATAAGIDLRVIGLDDEGSDDEAADYTTGAVEGLSTEHEQQLRRVFAVTDVLSRQQVCSAAKTLLLKTPQQCLSTTVWHTAA